MSHFHVASNHDILVKIAFGSNLWWNESDPSMPPLRRKVIKRYGHIFTNNQGTERANKDQNNAHKFAREEVAISTRLSATSWLREQCTAAVLGQKRIAWRGIKRIHTMTDRINFIWTRIGNVKVEIGVTEYSRRFDEILSRIKNTFQVERRRVAREAIEKVLPQDHVASAKEQQTGVHYSPTILGLLQFGKLFQQLNGEPTNNVELFRQELKGRRIEALSRPLTTEEEATIQQTRITKLKELIEADEKANFSHEYEDGTICTGGYNRLFFCPRHTQFRDWMYNKV